MLTPRRALGSRAGDVHSLAGGRYFSLPVDRSMIIRVVR